MFPIYSCFSVFNLHSGGTLVISWEKPHILKLIAVYEDVSLGKNVRGIFFPRCRINKALFTNVSLFPSEIFIIGNYCPVHVEIFNAHATRSNRLRFDASSRHVDLRAPSLPRTQDGVTLACN